MTFGNPHRHFRLTDSTNARARALVEAGAPGGAVVTAAEQTAGRGRQGRGWTAPPGRALLYSAILRPLDERHLLLPLAVPVAVCEAAEQLAASLSGDGVDAVRCTIKWPNDVWLDGKKLAGVLIEAKPQDGWAVIGVGMNLTIAPDEFPPDLHDTAISLFGSGTEGRGESRRSLPVAAPEGLSTSLLTATKVLSSHLDRWADAGEEAVLAAWRERDALRGREVAWEGGSGVADGVDDRGRLVVVSPGGDRVLLGAGEVHLSL